VITDDEARQNLAANLTLILRERHIPQRQLARATKRPVMSISNVCRGTRLPNVALVACIAEALGYSMEDLIGTPSRIAAREMLASGKKSLIPA